MLGATLCYIAKKYGCNVVGMEKRIEGFVEKCWSRAFRRLYVVVVPAKASTPSGRLRKFNKAIETKRVLPEQFWFSKAAWLRYTLPLRSRALSRRYPLNAYTLRTLTEPTPELLATLRYLQIARSSSWPPGFGQMVLGQVVRWSEN